MLTEAGKLDEEFELITADDDWHKNTGDAIAAQMRSAGINIKRTVYPSGYVPQQLEQVPVLDAIWYMRPFGVQQYALGYRTGQP